MQMKNEQFTTIVEKLKTVKGKSVWAAAAVEIAKDSDPASQKELIATLASQAQDNPGLMKKILGFDILEMI